ncbi:hypothetical protein [Methylobacterium haplocladii]|uniref:Uncharacterized protein n=1 Tax=Methylobacterium haplocladii TaxID=1176176 RepID=A0A512INH9_9HYPH|nr:hypothetical protein [Methylobacterium haplocladii]GEO99261.1 hypothetical protein MHA02_16490 [Methylobacterium haplocladii]GJD83538.1 hypothetical protein HPGCJGGD_1407 [Methylobacterium haplocladii]GLS60311.1 hypothetical protein GCM10007887_29900 [Methylobacterium haplocladii]
MVPFIAMVSPPDGPDAQAVEAYRVIVLALHRASAESAIKTYLDANHAGSGLTIRFESAWASPGFLKSAGLRPGEVRKFDPWSVGE